MEIAIWDIITTRFLEAEKGITRVKWIGKGESYWESRLGESCLNGIEIGSSDY